MGPGITIVGLGPASAEGLTREAWEILTGADEIYVRTQNHPALAALALHTQIHPFDKLYEEAEAFSEVYENIVAELLGLAQRPGGVIYAVPGDPSVGEATVSLLRAQASLQHLPLRLVSGVSFIEPCLTLLEIDALDGLTIADAIEIAGSHHPAFPPDNAVLVAQLHSQLLAADVKLTLLNQYPADHPIKVIRHAGSSAALIEELPLQAMDRLKDYDLTTTLYLPPLQEEGSFEAFQQTVAQLRAPDGCPWDREQTHQSLRRHIMEEAYEALEAIDDDDMEALKEELGDLLLQIVLQTQIATEEGTFQMIDVIQHIQQKLIRRHPHVFSDLRLEDVNDVLHNWEALKEEERGVDGANKGLLDGVPAGLPALAQAHEIQDRASRVGFDWPDVTGVLEKFQEEWQELISASSDDERILELGDLLFSAVNYARWVKIDPEAALRVANMRFRKRFQKVEELARESGEPLSALGIEELEALWQKAKAVDESH